MRRGRRTERRRREERDKEEEAAVPCLHTAFNLVQWGVCVCVVNFNSLS